jgi:hypothetical protein
MLCQESKDFIDFTPAPPGEADTSKCIEMAEKQMSEIVGTVSVNAEDNKEK